MTVTLKQIINAKDALYRLANLKLPIKKAYTITKLINKLEVELNNFNKLHIQLIEKYGDKDHFNGVTTVKDENKEDFTKEYEELGNVEVTIDLNKIELSEDLEISPLDLLLLEPFTTVKE